MKLKQSAQLHDSGLHLQPGAAHPVRVIKAGKSPEPGRPAREAGPENGAAHGKPIVRIVESGPDYTDLELVCGCGETTRFRCWSLPGKEEKGAV
jgi:hypothetical protein